MFVLDPLDDNLEMFLSYNFKLSSCAENVAAAILTAGDGRKDELWNAVSCLKVAA